MITKHRYYIIGLSLFVVLLIINFVVFPVYKIGKGRYMVFLEEATIAGPIISKVRLWEMHELSKRWFEETSFLTDNQIPHINWKIDSTVALNGNNAFYCLDQYSDDIRNLLSSKYSFLPKEKNAWVESFYTNNYFYLPEYSPSAKYKSEFTDSTISIVTGDLCDTWVYFPSKNKEEYGVYALEFDFLPNVDMVETLQIDFCMTSLSRRLRYNLRHNNLLRFEIVDRGCFTSIHNKVWEKYTKQVSLPLHKYTNIRMEIIEDKYLLYFNNNLQMAVRVNDGRKLGKNWAIIFWNGRTKREILDFRIKNFKILRPL